MTNKKTTKENKGGKGRKNKTKNQPLKITLCMTRPKVKLIGFYPYIIPLKLLLSNYFKKVVLSFLFLFCLNFLLSLADYWECIGIKVKPASLWTLKPTKDTLQSCFLLWVLCLKLFVIKYTFFDIYFIGYFIFSKPNITYI